MNYIRISFKAVSIFAVLMMGFTAMLHAQESFQNPLLQIQHEYREGFMSLDDAVLTQFGLLNEDESVSPTGKEIVKCATPAFMFLHQHRDELSSFVVNEVEKLQARNQSKKSKQALQSYISESGKFEIFYQISGPDSVSTIDENENGIPDYVEWVAEAADSSYRHEVLTIGFTDPIPSGEQYQVYIQNNLTEDAYGYTITDNDSPGGTVIFIEADFFGFPPNTHENHQIGAINVTMAHEFKHAIQYVNNKWANPAGSYSWSEMDATLMEEVVYDDVNDYYNYIKEGFNSFTPTSNSVFGNPASSAPGAYNYVTWMLYFSEAYGNDLWRRVWELIEINNSLGIDEALVEQLPILDDEFYFDRAFVQNHLWHFASGFRAGEDDYGFDEKEFYPNARVQQSFEGVPTGEINMPNIQHLAARYFEVFPSANDYGYIDVAVDFDSAKVGLGLLFYMKSGEIREMISTGENQAQVYLPSNVMWNDIERLGVVVANPDLNSRTDIISLSFGKEGQNITIRDPNFVDLPEQIAVFQNYPNPFNSITTLEFDLPETAYVELDIFDINGRKVQTLVNENRRFGTYREVFDGTTLASGVYLYRLRLDDEVFFKKMILAK